jgi:hypothetical protein
MSSATRSAVAPAPSGATLVRVGRGAGNALGAFELLGSCLLNCQFSALLHQELQQLALKQVDTRRFESPWTYGHIFPDANRSVLDNVDGITELSDTAHGLVNEHERVGRIGSPARE